jgi:hypothetical protein
VQQQALAAQQAAISTARDRYERGEISVEAFKNGLDALLLARSADECQAILDELPASPASALDALAPRPVALASAASAPPTQRMGWLVALMGGVNRTRRPWCLAEQTFGVALMGGIELDLRLATLPRQGMLRLLVVMGGVNIRVPPSVRVTVRSAVALGGVNALGEETGGVIAFGQAESQHPDTADQPTSELEIQVIALMGGVDVKEVRLRQAHAPGGNEPPRIESGQPAS